MNFSKPTSYTKDVWHSLGEAGAVLRFVWSILPRDGKKHSLIAIGLMFVVMMLNMSIPQTLTTMSGQITAGDYIAAEALVWQIAYTLIAAVFILAWQNYHREWGWNRNTVGIPVKLLALSVDKTLGEHRRNKNLGPEQIEITNEKVNHINYQVLFEGSRAVALLCAALIFIALNDLTVFVGLSGLIIFNLLWFAFVNHYLAQRIAPIDKNWREAQSWISERWVQMELVKRCGQEDRVVHEAFRLLNIALIPDFKLWGRDFQLINVGRELVNTLALVGSIAYGLRSGWEPALLLSMYIWAVQVVDQLGVIGMIARHMVEHAERIRVVKDTLLQEPDFRRNVGIVFTPDERNEHAV